MAWVSQVTETIDTPVRLLVAVFGRKLVIKVLKIVWKIRPVPCAIFATTIIEYRVVVVGEAIKGKALCGCPLPDDLGFESVLPKNLVEHDFDVMRGVPVAVVVEAAGLLEDTGHFDAARAHELNVSLGAAVAVLEGALLLGLAPEDFVVAVGVEGRVNVDEVHAGVG